MPQLSTFGASSARGFGLVSGAGGGGGGSADTSFEAVTLLLPGNGTNGAQNNTFLDSSTNNFSITRNGNPTQGTFSPFSQTGWSNYFDGNGDYLTFPANAAFTFGTGNFTIEGWVYIEALGSVNAIGVFQQGTSSFPTSVSNSVAVGVNPASTWTIYANGTNANSTATVSTKSWTHFALVRSGTTTTLYANGTSVIQITSDSTNYTGTYFGIGSIYGIYDTNWNGYISNLRVLKGTALYTSAFTPPTAPLTAISGTSLLTCQSNRFVDNSTNAFAITVAGNTSVQAFSPFNPTAAYSAGTVGGSGYFDGTGDYLSVADNAALDGFAGDFTIEFWVYFNSVSGNQIILDKGWNTTSTFSPYLFLLTGGNLVFYASTGGSWDIASGTQLITSASANTWYHIAVSRSGSTIGFYRNGTQVTTITSSSTFMNSATALTIGANYVPSAGYYLNGYVSNLRIVKGSAVYTAAFTPPTAPLTAVTNTSLLLNYTNAGITDATAKNVIETVGNASISTTQSKFGGSSLFFDGSADALLAPSIPINALGTGDFTIEAWIRWSSVPNSGSTYAYFFAIGGNNVNGMALYVQNGKIKLWNAAEVLAGSTTLSTNTWYYVALVRSSGTVKLYLNGTQDGTVSMSSNLTGGVVNLGYWYNIADTTYFSGYINDFRITKGIARYTTNFTPPTAPFPLL